MLNSCINLITSLIPKSQIITKSLLYRISNPKIYPQMQNLDTLQTLGIALILVKNPVTKKYLAVHEKDGSWWLPGGRIDAPELFSKGAVRETKEEGGVDVKIKGVLRFELAPNTQFIRNKIIFYAQPIDASQKAKDFKDKESLGAEWMTLEQIIELKSKWRGPQLYQWANYIQNGGKVFPLALLDEEQVYE